MKKILLVLVISLQSFFIAQAQCPGCIINTACSDATPGTRLPNLCPSTMPSGTVGMPYSEDLTIWLPQTFTYSGIAITILHVDVTSVSSLPAGLNLETSLGPVPVSFDVTSDMRLCAKVCGTPTVPGTRTIQLNVTVLVSTPLGNQTQNQSFPVPITINAPAGGNASFAFNASSGCDSLIDSFRALLTNDPYPVNYRWDLDNDGTIDDTTKTPPPVIFNTPGEHYVRLVTEFLNYRVSRISVNDINAAPWYWHEFCGDGTGVTIFGIPLYTQVSDADLTVQLTDGTNVYNGSEQTDQDAPNWNPGIPYNPTPGIINLSFHEVDPGICGSGQNGGVATITFTGARTYNFSTIGGDGTISGRVTIETYVESSIETIDTITVYVSPTAPILNSNKDSFCSIDSVQLFVASPTAGMTIEWYKDSALIAGASDSTLWVKEGGNYTVRISTPQGCSALSATRTIYKFNSPPGLLSIIQIPGRKLVNSNFPGAGFSIRWFLNGILIPGANTQIIDAVGDGNYTCEVYNSNYALCSTISGNYAFSSVGIDNSVQQLSNLSVFPNPSDGTFTLSFNVYDNSEYQIQITDMLGNIVEQSTEKSTSQEIKKTYHLNNLSSGMYLLHIQSNNNSIQKRIIIK
ncbi:MAG: T9SS type A sorting domain-containing protein [Bacteroidota bacterium]